MLSTRELRLRAKMAENDYIEARLKKAPRSELRRLRNRADFYTYRYRIECRREELGDKFNFRHELTLIRRERRGRAAA